MIVPFSIVRNGEATRIDDDQQWGLFRSNNQKNEVISLNFIDDIAVLKIRSFGSEKIISYIDSLALQIKDKAKGLIIDLRYNGGGSSHVAIHL